MTPDTSPLRQRLTAPVIALLCLAAASAPAAAQPQPAPLLALAKHGLTIIGTFPSPGGLTAYAAYMGQEPVALYVTPDGKHAIAGKLFDAGGQDITSGALEKMAGKPMADAAWEQLKKSHWIADGRDSAPRTVYVFTDPNCPYCNKLWADARPWVDAGRVQLRHVMVGILTPTSAGKAAALLNDKNPTAALAAYERGHAAANAKALASGRPRPLGDEGVQPLAHVPPALQDRLDANAKLMASFGLRATPAVVWRDDKAGMQMRQGVSDDELGAIFGPR